MRILIVEDDRDLAAALDDALRFEGYATRVAYNGLEAVRMLAEQSIDIVLLCVLSSCYRPVWREFSFRKSGRF